MSAGFAASGLADLGQTNFGQSTMKRLHSDKPTMLSSFVRKIVWFGCSVRRNSRCGFRADELLRHQWNRIRHCRFAAGRSGAARCGGDAEWRLCGLAGQHHRWQWLGRERDATQQHALRLGQFLPGQCAGCRRSGKSAGGVIARRWRGLCMAGRSNGHPSHLRARFLSSNGTWLTGHVPWSTRSRIIFKSLPRLPP